MCEEERRSSHTSTARSEQPQGELPVAASPPLHSSLEPDTIDKLAQATTSSLVVMIRGSFQMEVEKGLVYPHQTLLDDVQIDTTSYVVVKVDVVHENAKKPLKLEVLPNDTKLTLWDAISIGVQWRRTSIDVDPSAAAPTSTTASQPNIAPSSIFSNTQADQIQPCPSPIRE
jgi:hypothetical protein